MTNEHARQSLKTVALFAGIGGLDVGLEQAGHETVMLSEWDLAAQAVLRERFQGVPIKGDIREIESLPKVDLLTGGFPCQDISLAGTREGLLGRRSGLVWDMFRLIEKSLPGLVLIENVSHLLKLNSGLAMREILASFDVLGYRWAYRLVDTRGFGIPQRRLRVVILASRTELDPSAVLFAESKEPKFDDSIVDPDPACLYGFYWTEGKRGVGWARDAVPTIKGGSGLGIPSPPAIYDPRRRFAGTPTLRDAERLQGFSPGWTDVQVGDRQVTPGERWKMLGNAVSTPLSSWIGESLAVGSSSHNDLPGVRLSDGPLPPAARGCSGSWERVSTTTHVKVSEHEAIGSFLVDELKPLSARALNGYLHRVKTGHKKLPNSFVAGLEHQLHVHER